MCHTKCALDNENLRHLSKHSGFEAPEESGRQHRERLDPAASEPRGCDLEQDRCYVLYRRRPGPHSPCHGRPGRRPCTPPAPRQSSHSTWGSCSWASVMSMRHFSYNSHLWWSLRRLVALLKSPGWTVTTDTWNLASSSLSTWIVIRGHMGHKAFYWSPLRSQTGRAWWPCTRWGRGGAVWWPLRSHWSVATRASSSAAADRPGRGE